MSHLQGLVTHGGVIYISLESVLLSTVKIIDLAHHAHTCVTFNTEFLELKDGVEMGRVN